MDKGKLALLLAQHHHRELPVQYGLLSPAAEVGALLKEHAAEKQQWEQKLAGREQAQDRLLTEVTNLAYLLDEAVTRFRGPLEEKGLKRTYRELRVLKDKLAQILQEAGYAWRDPLGERFEGDLPELVNVDGWRYGSEYKEERVTQVREPIILRDGLPIKEGSVVVGTPEIQELTDETPSVVSDPGSAELGSGAVEAE